jgi:type II secretory pathway pseudopilin PulG
VIAIIGILSSVVLASLSSARARARDASRKIEMRQLQTALEMYLNSNNAYPSTGGSWYGVSSNGGSRTTSGVNAYIPGLTPTYISVLPVDPLGDTSGWSGFLYRSNGTNYKLLSHANGPESFPSVGQIFYDPRRPTWSWMICSGEPACSSW